jgi:hypothetical protein
VENTVLTEHQSACRAAHEQVQLLQHLYARLAEQDGAGDERIDAGGRIQELREDRQRLVTKLKKLGLLRTEPDPEREGLLDIATELKRAFGGTDDDALVVRLVTEEREFLRLCEQLAAHDDDEQIVETIDRTHAAIKRLSP